MPHSLIHVAVELVHRFVGRVEVCKRNNLRRKIVGTGKRNQTPSPQPSAAHSCGPLCPIVRAFA